MIKVQNSKFASPQQPGFTLIELLIVIGIIAVLVGLVVVAVNPGKQLAGARNNQREAHVNAIHGAIEHYDFHHGVLPTCVTVIESDAGNCVGDLVPVYLAEIPKDPQCANGDTGYIVKKDSETERIGVKADCAEEGEDIVAGEW